MKLWIPLENFAEAMAEKLCFFSGRRKSEKVGTSLFRKLAGPAVLLAFFVFFIPQAKGQFLMFRNSLEGQKAPDFTLTGIDGKEQNMTTLRDGQSAVIFFWATWCPHCRAALKDLTQKAEELKNKKIKIILVDLGEPAEAVNAYVSQNHVRLNVLLDEKNSVGEQYAIVGVPTFFLVNKNGIVKSVEHILPENYEEILKRE